MNFDLTAVPFSRLGSYIAFSQLEATENREEGLYLRSIHGESPHPDNLQEVFKVELLLEGKEIPFTATASASVLRLDAEEGFVEICIQRSKLVRVRGKGVGIRFRSKTTMFDHAITRFSDIWQITFHKLQVKYMFRSLEGQLNVDAPWSIDRSEYLSIGILPDETTGTAECAIEEFLPVWTEIEIEGSFEGAVQANREEFQNWLARMPDVPEAYEETKELAAYILWSCVVAPEGHLYRPAMLMSKNWMTSLWSWDNCFNAWALAYKHPHAAWDQFLVLMDHQDESGAFPDSVNDRMRYWTFSKPPIHGWALKKMMEINDLFDEEHLQEVYEPLCRWTQWWFEYRDDDKDGIPQYNHGNDSGWDNSTVFALSPPIESPDLTAFLILQMEALADIAEILGKQREAQSWRGRAKVVMNLLFEHSWKDDRFIAPRSGTHEIQDSESLLLYIPLILGERIPKPFRDRLLARLLEEGRFLTEHGLASESPQSPLYISDGYWRGPIWAPSTMIMVDALAATGEMEMAKEISRRYCDMAARSGMAENYDALTGEGLRDRAYTWTSSVFLILAHEYLMD
jgi:glycogen debranching enzyme